MIMSSLSSSEATAGTPLTTRSSVGPQHGRRQHPQHYGVVATTVLSFIVLILLATPTTVNANDNNNNDICGHVPGTEPPPMAVDVVDIVDRTTLHGKVMAGYQGWFDTPCSSYKKASWRHWAHFRGPAPNGTWYQFEMWPDVSEFDEDELCPTGFTYEDGSTAGLFSSYNPKTVDRHVKWMKDYNIDGVFVQRFITRFQNDLDERCFIDQVLDNIRVSSERHGRVFANMWDVSSVDESVYETIKKDWMYLVDVQEITKSRAYLHHKGLPLVSLWGFGTLNRPGEADDLIRLLQWFKNGPEKYRATVKGGVPNGWQDGGRDSKDGYGWYRAFRKFDVISPWSVGRFEGMDGVDEFTNRVTVPNAQECQVLGIDYMPVVWPGFSWYYKNIRYPDRNEEFNMFPRHGGKFIWKQFHRSVQSFPDGMAKQVYVAMFDEVDEATAMLKVAPTRKHTPQQGSFLTMDADGYGISSDFYLRLMGEATKSLRNTGSIPEELPFEVSTVPTPMPTTEPPPSAESASNAPTSVSTAQMSSSDSTLVVQNQQP